MKEFDSLLDSIGGFGRYQFLLMIPLFYYQVPGGLNTIAPVFLSYEPEFRCLMYPFDNATIFPNLSNCEITNITTPTDYQGKPKNPCVRYSYSVAECAENKDLECVNKSSPTEKCGSPYLFNSSLFAKTTVTQFNLVCNRKILNDISSSAFFVGVLISSLVTGYFLDRFGRRIPTILYCYGMLLSMLLTAYSPSVAVFSVARLLVAFFTFGCHLGTYCNVLEIVGTRWRMMVGVIYHASFCLGYMLWSIIAYIYRDWKEMQLACLAISAPLALMITLVPESPRWLLANGHFERGRKIVGMIAKLNKSQNSSIPDISETESFAEESHQDDEPVKYSMLDLFRYPGLRKSTIKLGIYSMVNNTTYYAIAYNIGNLSGNIFMNNVYGGMLEIAGNLFCLGLVKYTGRPKLLSIITCLLGILLIGSGVLCQVKGSSKTLSTLLLVCMILAKALASGSSAIFYCYLVEFYPTFIRGNGIGFSSTMARIGSISSPFLMSIGSYHLRWIPEVILGGASLAAGFVAISLIDTTDMPLRDTIQEVELTIEKHSLHRKRRKLYSKI